MQDKAVSPALPFLVLSLATILAVTFGTFATDLSRWIVCALSEGVCTANAKRDAAMVAAMVSTFVAIYGAAIAGLVGRRTLVEAKLVIVGAAAGALFAVLKAAEGAHGYPDMHGVAGPIVIYVLALIILTASLAIPRSDASTGHGPGPALRRTATVFFAGAVLGGAHQYVGQLALGSSSVRGMVIAPLVSVLGGALIGSLMLEPLPFRRLSIRIGFWLAVSGAAMLIWFLAIYLPRHGTAVSSISTWRFGVAYVGLPMVTIFLMAVLALVGGPEAANQWVLPALAVSAMVAALLGVEITKARELVDSSRQILVGIHASAPVFAFLVLRSARSLDRQVVALANSGKLDRAQ